MKNEKSRIKNVYIDREGDKFYINAEYAVTDEFGNVYKRVIKHLPIKMVNEPCLSQEYSHHLYTDRYIDLGFGNLRCDLDTVIETKLVHSTTKKMTIKEIEKALGHKVEIVS